MWQTTTSTPHPPTPVSLSHVNPCLSLSHIHKPVRQQARERADARISPTVFQCVCVRDTSVCVSERRKYVMERQDANKCGGKGVGIRKAHTPHTHHTHTHTHATTGLTETEEAEREDKIAREREKGG